METAGKLLKEWGPFAFIVLQFFLNVLVWKLSGRFATRDELKEQDEKIEKHDTRIGDVEGKVSLIEKELEYLPTSKDLCALKETIAKHTEIYKALKTSVKRFEDYLISEGQKK